jgi:hypothetical protein
VALTYGELGTLGFVWRSFAVLLVDVGRAPPARVSWPWQDGALEPSGFALAFSDTPSPSASCSTPSCHSHPRSTRIGETRLRRIRRERAPSKRDLSRMTGMVAHGQAK